MSKDSRILCLEVYKTFKEWESYGGVKHLYTVCKFRMVKFFHLELNESIAHRREKVSYLQTLMPYTLLIKENGKVYSIPSLFDVWQVSGWSSSTWISFSSGGFNSWAKELTIWGEWWRKNNLVRYPELFFKESEEQKPNYIYF